MVKLLNTLSMASTSMRLVSLRPGSSSFTEASSGLLPTVRTGSKQKLVSFQRFPLKCNSSAASSSSSSSSEVSVSDSPETQPEDGSWIPVVPVSALPRGERRLIRQDNETILLLWYKNDVYAIENKSPAEGAYSEGLFNARLTPDGSVVCPSTGSTFSLKTGEIKEWYPTNPVLKLLLKPTRELTTYPVKVDSDYIYIDMEYSESEADTSKSAEIVFSGQTFAGKTASDINIEEVRMVVEDEKQIFGFTEENEIINGRAAMLGFTVLLLFELLTGKGFLKGTGFLDFLYQYIK